MAAAQEVVALTRTLTRAVHDFLAERAREAGMHQADFVALIRIADGSGTTVGALGQALSMGSSSTTGLADRLEAGALISRVRHPTDRRAVVLHATRRGTDLLDRALGPALGRLGRVVEELDPEERVSIAAFLRASVESLGLRSH